MAKANVSAKVSSKHRSKKEVERLIKLENKLQGNRDYIVAPDCLTKSQKDLFDFIVREMADSEVLQNISRFTLAKAVEHYDLSIQYEKKRRKYSKGKNFDVDLEIKYGNQSIKFSQEFRKDMNELSLTPSALAKLAQLKAQALAKEDMEQDPLALALKEAGI